MKRKAPLPCAFSLNLFLCLPGSYRVWCILTAGLIFFCFTACDSRSDHERYIEWVRDYENGAHTRLGAGDFVFDLQYQPSEYVLLQRGMINLPEATEQEELQKVSGIQHYTLTVSVHGGDLLTYHADNAIEKQQRQYYFSYRFQNDIVLEENGRELPCVLFHFEKSASAGKGRTFVLGFENPDDDADEANVVIRSEVFGASPIRIKISKTNIPQVDL